MFTQNLPDSYLPIDRNSPHSTTGETPASLMFGRKLRTKIDQALPDIKTKVSSNQSDQVKSHSQAALRLFNIGDKVLVRDYRQHQRWQQSNMALFLPKLDLAAMMWRLHLE